jgi:hypothetical protein
MMAGGFILRYTILSFDPSSQRTRVIRETCRETILNMNPSSDEIIITTDTTTN